MTLRRRRTTKLRPGELAFDGFDAVADNDGGDMQRADRVRLPLCLGARDAKVIYQADCDCVCGKGRAKMLAVDAQTPDGKLVGVIECIHLREWVWIALEGPEFEVWN
ncbi:MAG: hypothetical protein KGS10_05640 [Chloroflexi bacterium]|nr:hypothetical protein [Chloroflexota bacterium]